AVVAIRTGLLGQRWAVRPGPRRPRAAEEPPGRRRQHRLRECQRGPAAPGPADPLQPRGDVARRVSPTGNPKLEHLPANRGRGEAELRGVIGVWKGAARPLGTDVRRPFCDWARTVGGILKANGLADFLGDYGARRTADDSLRRGVGAAGRRP